jgi:DNA-directed RNA polymerase specialized sigma24 family protein
VSEHDVIIPLPQSPVANRFRFPEEQPVPDPSSRSHPPPDDRPLGGLARRIADRDRAAFAALYAMLGDEIRDRVGARLGDTRDHEVVTRAVFVEMWRLAPAHCTPHPDVRAWLRAIADARAGELLRSDGMAERDPWWVTFGDVHDFCREQQFHALVG